MGEEEKKEEKKEEAVKESSGELTGVKKMVIMGGIIFGILAIFMVGTFIMLNKLKPEDSAIIAERIKKQKEEAERFQQTEIGKTLEAPLKILVNLAGEDSDRFLKTEINLEYSPEKEVAVLPAIEERLPKLKDIAIGVLSSCTFKDISDRSGKKKILTRLKNEMNKIFPEPETITNLYFDGFVVQ